MRLFIGLNNIASIFPDLKRGFSNQGVETFIVSRYIKNSAIINEEYDVNLQEIKDRFPLFKPRRITNIFKNVWGKIIETYYIRKSVKSCDAFIFLADSFRDDFTDLEYIKRKGKKIISVFVGDDVRWYYGMEQEFKSFGLRPINYDEKDSAYVKTHKALSERLTRIRMAEKNSDFIFSRLDQGQLQLRPYYRWNMMVYPSNIIENSRQRIHQPVIVHAPSTRAGKGTDYVLQTFDELKSAGYDFEVRLLENVSNLEALKIYADADIVIDQLLCPGAGKLSTEALAAGAIVMSHMAYDRYPQKNPSDCPIVDVNPDTLKSKLIELITNYELRAALAKKGRPYVEKYLDITIFCKKVIDLLQGKQIEFDYIPSFFRDHYIPTSQEEKDTLNSWTITLQHEPWYQTFVKKGEREGLIF